jgi:hypothetical protein
MMSGTSSTPAHERGQEDSAGELPARRRFRLREYTLRLDRRPGAVAFTFEMHCASCYAAGPVSTDPEGGRTWALGHLKANPAHVDFREHVTRSYRAQAGAWQ